MATARPAYAARPAPPTRHPPQAPPMEPPRGPRLPPLAGQGPLDMGPIKPPANTGPMGPTRQPPIGGGVGPVRQPPDQMAGDVAGPLDQNPTLGRDFASAAPATAGALPSGAVGNPSLNFSDNAGQAPGVTQGPQTGNPTLGAGAGGAPLDFAAAGGGTKQPPDTATGAPAAPAEAPIPAAQAGPIVDDLSKIQNGAPVSNKPGYSWFHTGAGGWVQAPTGQDPKGAAGGAAGAAAPSIMGSYEREMQRLLDGPSADEFAEGAGDSPEARAYRHAQQRNQERTKRQLAEDNAVGGGDTSNPGLEQAMRGLDQQAGESEGQMVADVAKQRYASRKAELMQAMQMAQAKGDADAQRKLQESLGQLDASVRNRGYDVQQSLGNREMDIRQMLGLLGLKNDRYGIDTNRNTALDRLGYDYTSLGVGANADAYDSL